MSIFYQWDYDNGIAIEYERIGECNQCGDCCKGGIIFETQQKIDGNGRNGGRSISDKGKWNEILLFGDVIESERVFFGQCKNYSRDSACGSFDEDAGCTIYSRRPLICQTWPHAPKDIARFRNCSYSFLEVSQWDFLPYDVKLIPESIVGAMV